MPSFRYEARDGSGRAVRGALEAPDELGALRKIQQMGLHAQRILARGQGGLTRYQGWARGYFSFVFHRVKSKDRAIWYRQFAYLLRAGMNLYEAADSIAAKTRNRTLRRVAREIAEAARRGEPPLPVVSRWPCVFPPFARSVVGIGHESGMMEEVFKRLSDFYDRVYALETLWRMETFYLKILILGLIFIPAVPILVMEGLAAYLAVVLRTCLWLGGLIVGVLLGWRALRLLPGFAEAADAIKLALPWFGNIVRRTAVARWARSLAMLLEAGVPVTRAVRESSGAAGNVAIEKSVARHASMLDAGQPLSAVLQASGQIPEQVIDVVTTGERSGDVAGMLDSAAEYYELESDAAHKQTVMTTVVVIFLILAVIVGIIVIGAYQGYLSGLVSLLEE